MIRRFQAMLFLFMIAVAPSGAAQKDRITSPLSNSETVVLKGSVSPLAKPENDMGPLDPTTKLPYVTMLLNPSPEQEAVRKQLLEDQQNYQKQNLFFSIYAFEHCCERCWFSKNFVSVHKLW